MVGADAHLALVEVALQFELRPPWKSVAPSPPVEKRMENEKSSLIMSRIRSASALSRIANQVVRKEAVDCVVMAGPRGRSRW